MVDVIKGLVGSLGASAFFGILFHIPRRLLVSVALVGMAGYGVYLTALALLQSAVGANFVAALAVALAAEILARRQKAPANIFSLIGIVPLVPGGGLYQTMLALVMDDYSAALSTGVQTMLIAGAIALAIAVVAVCFSARCLHAKSDAQIAKTPLPKALSRGEGFFLFLCVWASAKSYCAFFSGPR